MIGQTLGHYRILEKIGEGGMGIVYRAHDETLDRDVAVKVLPAGALSDAQARAGLLNEARSASALNHPNVCTIHEVGEANGQVYIVMEHVEGRSLKALIPPQGLPMESAVHYGEQIADALAHAHKRGVLHRDLKTANVVVTPEGHAKVLDFGLARRRGRDDLDEATRSRVEISDSGGITGTLAYLPPEVLQGEAADARSDIWALGVVLYEMAAGELPFQGRTGFDLSAAILRQPTAPLPTPASAGLRAVIQHCLAKEPGQRYQRASEVRAALEALQSETGQVVPFAPQAVPLPRRKRAWVLLGAAAAVLALLVGLDIGHWREQILETGTPRIESLAVLPLVNLSGSEEQDYFADGMTEALITDLAQIGSLRVISRTSVMQYKNAQSDAADCPRTERGRCGRGFRAAFRRSREGHRAAHRRAKRQAPVGAEL